jgi:polysaccharide biosynthesis PFTS motif protein
LQNRLWLAIFKNIKPAYFCYSFSAGWPEPYEVAVANALGIKTINWFYGTSEFGYTKTLATFNDCNVRFAVRAAQELWVWNPLIKDLIEKRSFLPSQSHIEVVGPILNGNWNLINETSAKNQSFTIAVFDITPMKPRMRLQHGEGPYCDAEMQDRIYQTVFKIHQLFPSVRLLIKTKRANNPQMFESQPTLTKLLSSNLDRIEFLTPNSDPYLAIQEADLVISTPYTSPSMLALSMGRKGLFYDPTRTANYTFKNAFKNLTVSCEEDLISLISEALKGSAEFNQRFDSKLFPFIKPSTITQNLISRLR